MREPATASPAGSDPGLRLAGATLRFGGLTAVNAVDLAVGEGELVGLIGPNGAGKTTLFNLITGVYRPTAGTVSFQGRPLAGRSSHEIAALGVARTFQNIRLFGRLSVFDNVRVAGNLHRATGALQTLWRGRAFRVDEAAIARRTEELLEIFHLGGRRDEPALSLAYGEQRRLEIARSPRSRGCSSWTSPPRA
jgi:branched-chain amino acid transport system ATP-binding protein